MPSPIPSSSALSQILTNPANQPYLALLKGARNGAVYGTKVRFPHALVMTFLWGHGDWKTRMRQILSLTRQHATGLATFVAVYKLLLLVQRRMNGNKPRPFDPFVAGVFGGYIALGNRTSVNEQIALYISSRVLLSFLPRAYEAPYINKMDPVRSTLVAKRPIPPNARWFRMFSALAWGTIMYRLAHYSENFQPGLLSSMQYLYVDSEWWDSLKTLLWHNK